MKILFISDIEVCITDTQEELNALSIKARGLIISEGIKVLGFDTEFINSSSKATICTIQLACNKFCYVFRLCINNKDIITYHNIPEALKSILRNDEVVKVGLGITQDVIILSKYNIHLSQVLDIHSLTIIEGIGKLSMDKLATQMMSTAIKKGYKPLSIGSKINVGKTIYTIDWSNPTDSQLKYAANDALINIDLLNIIMNKRYRDYMDDIRNNEMTFEDLYNIQDEYSSWNQLESSTSNTIPLPKQILDTPNIDKFTSEDQISLFYTWMSAYLKDNKMKLGKMKNYAINAYSNWAKEMVINDRKDVFDKVIKILIDEGKVIVNDDAIRISIVDSPYPIHTFDVSQRIYNHIKALPNSFISLNTISSTLSIDIEEVYKAIIILRNKGLVYTSSNSNNDIKGVKVK